MSCISPFIFVLLQLRPAMSPLYYYAAGVIRINWYVVAMSSLADVVPRQWRAPSFGILSAGYSAGQALSPRLSLWLGYLVVSVISLVTLLLGLCIVVLCLPETLSEETRVQAYLQRTVRQMAWWYRPLWELSILNRTSMFRMLCALAFFSGMVSAADYTLLLYYIQERVSGNDQRLRVTASGNSCFRAAIIQRRGHCESIRGHGCFGNCRTKYRFESTVGKSRRAEHDHYKLRIRYCAEFTLRLGSGQVDYLHCDGCRIGGDHGLSYNQCNQGE